MSEQQPLLINTYNEVHCMHHPTGHSWIFAVSLTVGSMAGGGVLAIPEAVEQTGWAGIALLFIIAVINCITGVLLGKVMEQTPAEKMVDYASIGRHVYRGWAARWAVWASTFSQYVTLGGVSIIFLVLVGLLMHALVPKVPHGFWTLVVGVCVSFVVLPMKTLGEAKWMSAFAIVATAAVVFMSVVVSLLFRFSADYAAQESMFAHQSIKGSTLATGFSVFTFAFGATALFPNIYAHMSRKEDWDMSMYTAYGLSFMLLYLPIAVVGYYVYGAYLAQTSNMIDALSAFAASNTPVGGVVMAATALIIVHLLTALPIVLVPVLNTIERRIVKPDALLLLRLAIRAVTIASLTVIALFFPYFLDIISIVTCVSVSMSCYILPCLFYWQLIRPGVGMKILLVLIMLFGLLGSGVGIYVAIDELIQARPAPSVLLRSLILPLIMLFVRLFFSACSPRFRHLCDLTCLQDVSANPNPFKGLFTFT
eukprot:TRINITY_DN22833_c0_g1_i1.p1 TRINITY_DN22833_c0_g1~~TRINITY_DN22833_c0_g1_i1.p1  ORF type:complete len:480 (-),score=102.68 TRINITY_DN22833_c0_g1_i1:91-1530(-)